MTERNPSKTKPIAVSRRIIKGISRCDRCKKERLECRRISMSDGSKVIACVDCMSSRVITGKKPKKLKVLVIPSSFESSRRKH